MDEEEEDMVDFAPGFEADKSRLSCQLRVRHLPKEKGVASEGKEIKFRVPGETNNSFLDM